MNIIQIFGTKHDNIWDRIVGLRRKELEKIMLDYMQDGYLDFCMLKYIILKELGLEKLKIR